MTSPTTPSISSFIPPDFFQKIMGQATAQVAQMLGAVAESMWQVYQPYIPVAVAILFVLLLIAIVKASFGRWGSLGSLLYHIFYFGLLGIIIWIKGWGVLLSDYFDIIAVLLYPLCYWLTGLCIKRFRHRP